MNCKTLHQPIDTEEDPLRLVLAESGYSDDAQNQQGPCMKAWKIWLRPTAAGSSAFSQDGLPICRTR